MLQARQPGGDGRWHSPDRDLAYAWPCLTQAALDQLAPANWKPWFEEYFKFAGVTEADIGAAAAAYAKFFGNVCAPGVDTPRQALERAGWFDLKPAAQVALFMKLGQVATMAFFTAIRDVTPLNEAPPVDLAALAAAAHRAHAATAPAPRPGWWRAYLRGLAWPFRRGGAAG